MSHQAKNEILFKKDLKIMVSAIGDKLREGGGGNCVIIIVSLRAAYLFGTRVCVTGLLLAEQCAIHRIVLLELHSLHLLLDRVHGDGFGFFFLTAVMKIFEIIIMAVQY